MWRTSTSLHWPRKRRWMRPIGIRCRKAGQAKHPTLKRDPDRRGLLDSRPQVAGAGDTNRGRVAATRPVRSARKDPASATRPSSRSLEWRYQRINTPLVLQPAVVTPAVNRDPVVRARDDSLPIHERSGHLKHVPYLNSGSSRCAARTCVRTCPVLRPVDFVRPSDIEFRVQA